MKTLLGLLLISTALYAQDTELSSEGPRFDSAGHLLKYVHAGGKCDIYTYDSQWRMIRFINPDGKVTIFKYAADGSMTVVEPDGSQQ
jgi:YD repeat-containing protein